MNKLKKCSICKVEKSFSFFTKLKSSKDGAHCYCRECKNKQRQTKYREKDLEYQAKYRENNKESIAIGKRRYKDNNREKYNEYRLEYYINNKEKLNARQKKYSKSRPWMQKANTACRRIPIPIGYSRHHWSYNDEHLKDIIPLPKKIHQELHELLVFDKELLIFKVKSDGYYLDTKEKHLFFLNRKFRALNTIPPFRA